MNLEELRQKINEKDKALIKLLSERMEICKEIKKVKGDAPVTDLEREKELLELWLHEAKNYNLPEEQVKRILEDILHLSKKIQKNN